MASARNGESILDKVITATDLAVLAGLSERHVRRLTKSGVIGLAKDKAGRVLAGRYVLGESISRLFEYVRESLANDDADEKRFRAARAERAEYNTKLSKLDYEKRRGQLVEKEKVVFCWGLLISNLKARAGRSFAGDTAADWAERFQGDLHDYRQRH